MAIKRRPFADEDGNIINEPPPDSPIAQIIYLLEYGRQRGFKIGPTVQVGDTTVQVTDLRQLRESVRTDTTEVSIWKQHGYDGDD